MSQPSAAATAETADVNLERFESLVYSRQHEEAVRYLLTLLVRMRTGAEFAAPLADEEARAKLYSRLAAAITALIADPALRISQEGFYRLTGEYRTLDAIFQSSVFENSDHLLRQFGVQDPAEPAKLVFDSAHVAKLLLSYSLHSGMEPDFEAVVRAAPALAVPSLLGMLGQIAVFSPAAHRRREKLLQLGPLFEIAEINESMFNNIQDTYMHCSYASSPGKHAIKRSLNAMLRRFLESRIALPAIARERPIKERPTIVLPVEYFNSLHAMYRCYAPSVRKLRERFRLVVIGRSNAVDATSKQLFDEAIELNPSRVELPDVVRRISEVAPDMIYYPSVGMDTWVVALASIRLAPIQCMTMGHPATSNSAAMDYFMLPELTPSDATCFGETVVLVSEFPSMVMRGDARFIVPDIRRAPEVLRVAVPAMAAKISVPFLDSCRKILSQVRRPLEFHFFAAMRGVNWYQTRKQIRKWVPGAVVHPPMHYNAYLQTLAACDVHLSTYPFGGTNSNIDSMKLGIPIVTLEGREAHGQTDAAMMRMAGLPEWLIAHSEAEFEAAALRLLASDGDRCAIAEQLRRTDIDAAFMDNAEHRYTQDFSDALWWLYTAHEAIQANGRRYWTVEERRRFEAKSGVAAKA